MSLRILFVPQAEQFACYNCRFATQWPEESFREKATVGAPSIGRPESLACPYCGRPMHNMGRGFVPPASSDDAQWQKVALLVQHDFSFELL